MTRNQVAQRVYVDKGEDNFEPRLVQLGLRSGGMKVSQEGVKGTSSWPGRLAPPLAGGSEGARCDFYGRGVSPPGAPRSGAAPFLLVCRQF
ncbi:MAG: hypothetical protein HQL61_12015 [Magnetococcales bacterium]|nr:hypothetical protein [Nitrospirota bacterium]